MPGQEKFDVFSVSLQGRNLVEASAGTGKTFSIALLTLRLVLEKEIPVEKILLVTFTKNAVAELEERIRLFVRMAHDYAVSGEAVPGHIERVVNESLKLRDREAIQQALKEALLFLDQLSVMTIHGFCQQALRNQAFETGQLFGVEIQTSMDDLFDHYVNDFWRRHINTLPMELYTPLREHGFDRGAIVEIIQKYFSGKPFFQYDASKKYALLDEDTAEELAEHQKKCAEARKRFNEFVEKHREDLRSRMQTNANARKWIDSLDDADEFWKSLKEKGNKNYVNKLFGHDLLPIKNACDDADGDFEEHVDNLIHNIYCFAIQDISGRVQAHMNHAGLVSYDGLIKNLHKAIQGTNRQAIVQELQAQYAAVFIDEFQDTDRLQYEIFKTAFGGDSTMLFYIGDPKQSIYAWRQADINTYFTAREDVTRQYTMNTNFRSTKRLVDAMNAFFLPEPDFDTFHFENANRSITYNHVEANENATGALLYDGAPVTPMAIERHKNKESIFTSAALTILNLLSDSLYQIQDKGVLRPVKPSDIGVLVRSKTYGHDMKQVLNRVNIPAVIFNDEKIMKSDEAAAVVLVLKAMHNPTAENINAAVLNSFTGKSASEVKHLKKEQLIELFRTYKTQWETQGINLALTTYIRDFGITEYLIRPDTINGLRIISNLNQIKELLTRVEYQQRLNQPELLDWMNRAKDLELLDEDERVIRLENDADSVTISTIHKAKGLQYNIVIAPNMDLAATTDKKDFVEFYNGSRYVSVPVKALTEEMEAEYLKQAEQENRRLMYVAITRAVYACFIYKNNYHKSGGLTQFLAVLKPENGISITEINDETFAAAQEKLRRSRYSPATLQQARPETIRSSVLVRDPFWQFMSYSGLSSPAERPETIVDAALTIPSDYDEFIFHQLRKGSITGTMLHEIFEKIDFQNAEKHGYVVADAVRRFAASKTELYNRYLPELIGHVLAAKLPDAEGDFTLEAIPQSAKLAEMEFDFSVHRFALPDLVALCQQAGMEVAVVNRSELYGIMNGFIDLFFEYEGKYYILDWKSNYLGNRVEDYEDAALEAAMTLSNYHLQYLIYTVALTKYLRQRLPAFDYSQHFGGVFYCFLRGMRSGESSGVYSKKPDKGLIESMEALLSGYVPHVEATPNL